MSTKIILSTDRLHLEEATFKDADFFLELLNSPNWIEHIGDREVNSKEAAIGYIQRSHIHFYKKYGYGMYKVLLKENNEPIGLCGLVKRPTLSDFDLGFAVLPAYEGFGYTYEASKAVLKFAQTNLKLQKVVAFTTKENTKSQNLLTKLGLEYVDTRKVFEEEDMEFLFYQIILENESLKNIKTKKKIED